MDRKHAGDGKHAGDRPHAWDRKHAGTKARPEDLAHTSFGIGALSRKTSVHVETIRYYEKIELLAPPPRSAGGQRRYDGDFVRRLSFISSARALGFKIDDIRALLSLADGERGTCAQVRALTLDHAERARRKSAELQKLAQRLETLAAACHGAHLPGCAVVDALFGQNTVVDNEE